MNDIQESFENAYAEDNPALVYRDLKNGERDVLGAANALFDLIKDEVNAHDAYEFAKNTMLKDMYDEEATGGKKRTEMQRQVAYRLAHRKARLDWQLAKRDVEAQKQFLEALLGIQTSIEARAKLISLDERFAGRNYGP